MIVKIIPHPKEGFPEYIGRNVYYARIYNPSFDTKVGAEVKLEPTDKYVFVGSFRSTVLLEDGFYNADMINGQLFIDSQLQYI